MSYVLVSADCSCCNPGARALIYQQLAANGWERVNGENNNALSIWLSALDADMFQEDAVADAKERFNSCFNPNCKPNIVFHWGPVVQGHVELVTQSRL